MRTTESYFSREDALALMGRAIRIMVEFSGVPEGTSGTVTRADKGSYPEGYTVAIQWDLPERRKPLVDWFTMDEYYRFLEEAWAIPDSSCYARASRPQYSNQPHERSFSISL